MSGCGRAMRGVDLEWWRGGVGGTSASFAAHACKGGQCMLLYTFTRFAFIHSLHSSHLLGQSICERVRQSVSLRMGVSIL